ncbi:MAG: hypothetical protein ACI9SP_002469 [Arenicella sp.]|jgi:hypothetical protein
MNKVIFFAFALSLMLTTNALADVKIKLLAKKKWTLVESENFKIITDISAKKARLTTEQLEKYRAFCAFFLNAKPQQSTGTKSTGTKSTGTKSTGTKNSDTKMILFMTDARRTWKGLGLPEEFVSIQLNRPGMPTRMFVDIKGFFGNSFRVANSGRSVVFNAIAQDSLNSAGIDERYPLWFRVGFAYYLATYTETSNRIVLGSLEAYTNRISAILNSGGGVTSFNSESLFARTTFNQKTSTGNSRQWLRQANRNYMHSFFTVHYLYADNTRREQLIDYLRAVISGQSQEQVFVTAFSMDYTELDKDLRQYVSGSSLSARAMDRQKVEALMALPVDESYKVSRIDDSEFFKYFAQAIIELDESTIPNQDKQSFLDAYKERYKPSTTEIELL